MTGAGSLHACDASSNDDSKTAPERFTEVTFEPRETESSREEPQEPATLPRMPGRAGSVFSWVGANGPADPLDQPLRHVLASAGPGDEHLELPTELVLLQAWRTVREMRLDLEACSLGELSIEEQLDLSQELVAINRRQGHAPASSPTTVSRGLFFPDAAGT